MGTPHQGGQGLGVGKMVLQVAKLQRNTSSVMLNHLEQHSELLQQQMSEFSLISRAFDIRFAYETKPTIIGGMPWEVNEIFFLGRTIDNLTITRSYRNGLL